MESNPWRKMKHKRELWMKELDDKPCPVCGKIANSRYYNEAKKVWVYRHRPSIRKGRYQGETIYHEAAS